MLIVVFATTMLDQIFDSTAVRVLTTAALGIYIVVEWRETSNVGKFMLVTILVVAGVSFGWFDVPAQVLLEGVKRGALFVTLFMAIGLLQEAAEISPMMRRCGEYLVHQPPSRRYLMLSFGSHLCAIVLSIGTLNLLAGVINRTNTLANADGKEWVREMRRKRMAMALMRGFNATVFWSPLSIALIVSHTSIGYGQLTDFIPVGIAAAVVFLLWGWVTDVLAVPRHLRASVEPLRSSLRWTALLRVALLVLGIFLIAWALARMLNTSLIVAMLFALPPLSFIWTLICVSGDNWREQAAHAAENFWQHAKDRFPTYRSETSMVATAGALGVMLSHLVPAEDMAALISATHLSGLPLVLVLALTVFVLGQFAIVPLVSVSILASILPPPDVLGVSPELLMLTFVGAWSLTTQSSIFTGTIMVTARLFDQPPTTIAYRWNRTYTYSGLLLLCLMLTIGSRWL